MKRFRLQSVLLLTTGLLLVLPQFAFAGFNEFLQDAVFNIVMGILGMFVWLSALLLNFAVNNFIIGFGNTFATTGVGVAVDNTWVIVRDFVNLGFIFGFVYIGFKMILSSSDSNTRRWLVNIILAALLVNFSLFVVKFAIDVSNQLAAQIAVNGLGSTCTDPSCTTEDGLRQIDIASEFMARLGLSKVFSLTYETVNGAGWGYIFGSALLSLTAMFVFAAGGILIIIRFAVLCLFMVLSPIMFLSWILPPVKDTFERFWSMFMGRAFFAPIYLLFIYFSLQIISGLQLSVGGSTGGFGNPDWAGTFQGAGKLDAQGNAVLTLGTFPFFVLAMIFMGASLVIANKLGADFGDKAVGLGKSFERKVRGAVGSSTLGVGARIGRNTAGSLANKYANSEYGKARAANSLVGKLAYKAAGKTADYNFDVRSIGGIGGALGIGEGRKGGYQSAYKEKLKKEQEFVDSIKIDEDDAKEGKAKQEVADFKRAEAAHDAEKEKEQQRVARDRKPYDDEIQRLKNLYTQATTTADKDRLTKEIEQQRGFISDIKDQSDARVKVFEKAMKDAEKKMNEAITRVQYEQVDAYLKNQERWSQGVRNNLRKSSIIAASLVGMPGAIAATGMTGEYFKDEAIKAELRKKIEGEKKKRRKGEKPSSSGGATPATPKTP